MAKNLHPAELTNYPSNLEIVMSYLKKMRGGNCPTFQAVDIRSHLITAVGSFLGIGLIALLNTFYDIPLLVPSLGASAVLLYSACHVPMAQPRNVIGGHLVSAMAGVVVYQWLGNQWWTIALAVTLAIFLMNLTHTLHPPGGATAFVAVYTSQSFTYIFSPVLLGATLLVIIAVLVNNFSHKRHYPNFWF
ncbi:HPP family protein+B94 [Desulforamulus reducens MI-1]|uniref:HPP family protein+B94 n=1 Tax=Desulforamulus reducens (strain ATCC BAA-1160 / DSM 100696 / MI-1) TaxID=349161 RepID=A4J8P3_DESRM|nr:HPP family protein [Desulforamulus reducens]ABO51446.1 HPP family protein+B94 [Desulforamulus reducens MI-1]